MTAILFGSISTLADTSELQRRAFNEAFSTHDLDWNWSQEDYADMLTSNGGAERIADYASSKGQEVDSAAVHSTKSSIFQKLLATEGIEPRPGVLETVAAAREHGYALGLVTTTSRENVSALLDAFEELSADSFDIVVDKTVVDEVKPDPAAYRVAIDGLGENADECIAIEDNVGGVDSASAASVRCVAFPNSNTVGGNFSTAVATVDRLDPDQLVRWVEGRG
ncbi:HAD-IA family hydrolase [Gordonia McavH-238-E]|uniref:HAD family hydrolase n=1 Tax=Gordonia sp. McavH-238-E TaxID=2917736 RepID=UPI001EF3F72A|nr:HAD-IA family hydrolase [Gordonia sp. McavH-238-E]MCG7634521.1 HAD-IA family hydrolase [Gordonia sp. McavH-238-E]